MKFSLKESIINISLILLCLITLFGCIYFYNNRETKIENVSLVKDMTDSVGRIKTDKSEKLSKTDRPAEVLEENGIIKNEDGSLTLIIPEPENKKEVEEVIIPEPEPEVVIKSNGKVGEVKVTNKIPNETEPLPLYEIGEVIEEIRKESTTDLPKYKEYEKHIDVLMKARTERNKGRTNLSTSFAVLSTNGNYVSLGDITKNASVIIVFDSLDTKVIELIKKIDSIYSEYNSRINIVLLQSTFDMSSNATKIINKLNEHDITTSFPMYFDKEMMFYSQTGVGDSVNCVLMNSDCYVVEAIKADKSVSDIKESIEKLIKEESRIAKENENIKATGVYEPIIEE